MSGELTQWYPSKIDWWLIPILCLPPISAVVVFSCALLAGAWVDLLVATGVILFVAFLYLGLVFPIRYGLDDSRLTVRFGLCRQRIPLADITDVYPTSNPLSSPALSLDRLHVQFGRGIFKAIMISPADRDRFLDDLAGRTGLERVGDRLKLPSAEVPQRAPG